MRCLHTIFSTGHSLVSYLITQIESINSSLQMRAELELWEMTGVTTQPWWDRNNDCIFITFSLREFGKIWLSSSCDLKIFPAILAGLAGPGISRLRGDQSDPGMISLRLPIYSWPLSRTISQHLPPHTSHLSPPNGRICFQLRAI